MSHFSVCVIVPDDGVVNNIHANNLEDHLIPVLAPFDEQTEEEKYREFEDRTEEAKADFENDTMRVVRFPDGSIHSIYDDAFNKFFFVEDLCVRPKPRPKEQTPDGGVQSAGVGDRLPRQIVVSLIRGLL